ncbi:hypothetical protein B0H13DRAFT_2579111 [Mycena leptocephala]|nr:hypothetical protein B0H13DRAFT_2579111 [Mycena leptocephala]
MEDLDIADERLSAFNRVTAIDYRLSLQWSPFVWHDCSLLLYGLKIRASWRGRDILQVGVTSRRDSASEFLSALLCTHLSTISRISLAILVLESIAQGHCYDVFENIACQSLPTYLYPSSISLLSASYTVIMRRPPPLRLLPPARPIPPAFMRALTTSLHPPPSRTGPLPRIRRSTSLPHRPSPTSSSTIISCILAHSLVACADEPYSGVRAGRRRCVLAFLGPPRPLHSRGGRFLGLDPLPSLFAFVGVRLPWRKHKSFRPPHAREGAQRDPFTPVKQLRPLSRHTCAPRASRAPVDGVDGDGEARILGCGPRCRLMKMEKHADGMESRQRWSGRVSTETECRYACAYITPPPSCLGCAFSAGTRTQGRSRRGRALSFCPPAFAFALAFAHTLASTLLLVPAPPSPFPHCVVRNAQASSCGGMHTHSCTRRDGEARLRVRVWVRCEHLLPLIIVLVIPLLVPQRAAGAVCICVTHRTWTWVRACMRVRMGLTSPSSSHSRSSSSDLPLASLSFFHVDTEGVRSADLGIILAADAHSYEVEVGMDWCGSVVGARTLRPLPPLLSLAIFS